MRISTLPQKLKGVNIMPLGSYTGTFSWQEMWLYWDDNWPLVQLAIDKAVDELNINCFRWLGDLQIIFTGQSTRAEQLARYEEYIDYVTSKGCYVYACAGAVHHLDVTPGTQASFAAIQAEIVAFAEMCATKENVVCVELLQEIMAWPVFRTGITDEETATFAQDCTTAVRAAIGNVKDITMSYNHRAYNSSIWSDPLIALTAGYFDILDFHPYYKPMDLTEMNPVRAYGKPIVWGETGVARLTPSSGFDFSFGETRNEYINKLAEHIEDPDLYGFLFWGLQEDTTGASTGSQHDFYWGLYDGALEPYIADDVSDFAAIQIPSLATVLAGQPTGLIAKTDISFADAGINADNTNIIIEVGEPLKSFTPGGLGNDITGFVSGKGYYIIPKSDINLKEFCAPPL